MAEFILRKEGDDETVYKVEGPDRATAAGLLATGAVAKTDRGTFAFPEPPLSVLEKIGEGAADPLYGLQQLYRHTAGTSQEAVNTDNMIAQREAALKARGMQEGDLARAGGRMIPALAVGAATGGLGMPGAVVGGALTEAANPIVNEEGDYWAQKSKEAVTGGLLGYGTAGFGKVFGGAVAPALHPDVRNLANAGVQMTPGRLLGAPGGWLARAENAIASYPILGSFIRGAEGRSLESYNKATINQALEPLGIQVPNTVRAGHDALEYAHNVADHAYDQILRSNPQLRMPPTIWPHLEKEIKDTAWLAQSLPPHAEGQQFQQILHNYVWRNLEPLAQGQPLSAAAIDGLDSQLRYFVSTYKGAPNPAQREMARYIDDVRSSLRDALAATNPAEAAALRNADYTWAMLSRIDNAAARRVASQGVFSPTDMLYAVRSQDRTVRKNAFARGDALMQDFAEIAQRVLPSRLPDSGTAERHLFTHIPKALAAGAGAAGATKAAIGLGAASLPYTKYGMTGLNWLAQQQPGSLRDMIGESARTAAPYLGTMVEPMSRAVTTDSSEKTYPRPRPRPVVEMPEPQQQPAR